MDEQADLDRFVNAQDDGGMYANAVRELRGGRKETHWMWFVFPQIGGLGHSSISRRYSIASLAEARAYLRHPVLGRRLVECAGIVATSPAESAEAIFGPVDAMKLLSSMTLFDRADPAETVFRDVLDRYFGGGSDPETERRL
jgi:uncharacterized protein (DUF1810 family)